MELFPESLAIAGAWGYIGRKFMQAAVRKGVPTFVFDPGLHPSGLDLSGVTEVVDEDTFYRLPVPLFHLAMHPEFRRRAIDRLLPRSAKEGITILNEKPMAAPESPDECARLVRAVETAGGLMWFDFPELFDPLTERILNYLRKFREVKISGFYVCRAKDREAVDNPRNQKRMVPIQYQESVHCLAFVLYILGQLRGELAAVFEGGLTASAESAPYQPPNPQAYPYVVDGRCVYQLALGPVRIEGRTDFKSGAEHVKRRVISGFADGMPFQIDVNYQEGEKSLKIDGADQRIDPEADSYENVLRTLAHWRRRGSRTELMSGVRPHPRFAQLTYQMSSVIWRACHDAATVRLPGMQDLLEFDAGFAAAVPSFDRYR